MHVLFTEKEKEWIFKDTFGWPVKRDCPKDILESINGKKKILNSQDSQAQMERMVNDGK